jgi:acid phosphatase (class A)
VSRLTRSPWRRARWDNNHPKPQMKNIHQILTGLLASTLLIWSQPAASPARAPGYLTSEQTSGVVRVVLPAPTTGDARYQADMAIFRATRSLEGSPRWTLAQGDDNLSIAGLLNAFRCALGLTLTPEDAPKLTGLIARAYSDAGAAANVIKIRYRHKRPFQVAEGDVCLSPQGKLALEHSPDYPSSHAALSWDAGSILAELVPEAAIDVLARARAFGQSRIVCGVHNSSAVEAGWMIGAAVFAMQADSTAFQKDLDAARTELVRLRAHITSKPTGCEAEAETLLKYPY